MSSDMIHVIIRPQQEQQSQISSDTSYPDSLLTQVLSAELGLSEDFTR